MSNRGEFTSTSFAKKSVNDRLSRIVEVSEKPLECGQCKTKPDCTLLSKKSVIDRLSTIRNVSTATPELKVPDLLSPFYKKSVNDRLTAIRNVESAAKPKIQLPDSPPPTPVPFVIVPLPIPATPVLLTSPPLMVPLPLTPVQPLVDQKEMMAVNFLMQLTPAQQEHVLYVASFIGTDQLKACFDAFVCHWQSVNVPLNLNAAVNYLMIRGATVISQ